MLTPEYAMAAFFMFCCYFLVFTVKCIRYELDLYESKHIKGL